MPDITATLAGPAQINVAVGSPIVTGEAVIVPHSSTHASGGNDALSPSAIGALSVGEGIAYAIALG